LRRTIWIDAGNPALLIGYARLDPKAIRQAIRRLASAITS
jgi:hypothetical protein